MNSQPTFSVFNLFLTQSIKKNFMAAFYGWGSTASRLEPLRGGSLLFTDNYGHTIKRM